MNYLKVIYLYVKECPAAIVMKTTSAQTIHSQTNVPLFKLDVYSLMKKCFCGKVVEEQRKSTAESEGWNSPGRQHALGAEDDQKWKGMTAVHYGWAPAF